MDLNPIHGSRSKLLVGVANFKKMFSIQLAAAAKKVAPKPKAKAAAPKAAKKDAVKPKKLVAAAKPKKVAAAWLAVAWSIVVGLIFLSRAGDGTAATADGRAEPELWSPYPEAEAGARSCRESSSSTPWRCLSSVRPGDVVPHPCLDGAEAAPQPILPTSVTCQHRPPYSIHSRRRSAGDELATTAGFPVLPSYLRFEGFSVGTSGLTVGPSACFVGPAPATRPTCEDGRFSQLPDEDACHLRWLACSCST